MASTARPSELSDRSTEEFSGMVAAVTAAFGDPTRRDIYMYARRCGPVTAAEVAGQFGLHPNVARHHLDKLAAGGYLEVTIGAPEPPGGAGLPSAEPHAVGRPSKRYAAPARDVEGGIVDFPARRGELLVMLLGKALEMLDQEAAECMAEEVGEEYGRALASHMRPGAGRASVGAALRAVADALTAHGFAAHTEARNDSMAVVSENCPFGDAATVNPVVCAVDRGLVRGMLSALSGAAVPVTMSSRARGDDACATVV